MILLKPPSSVRARAMLHPKFDVSVARCSVALVLCVIPLVASASTKGNAKAAAPKELSPLDKILAAPPEPAMTEPYSLGSTYQADRCSLIWLPTSTRATSAT